YPMGVASVSRQLLVKTISVLTLALCVFSIGGAQNRPVVGGLNGIVVSNHPMASFAGIEILQQGGSAVDAAVSVAATLGVTEPYLSGAGGEGFMMYYDAETEEVYFLNMTGTAPGALDLEHFLEDESKKQRGALSALVPGAVAGWH